MSPHEERAAEERRFRRAFEDLPKSRYWRTSAHAHIGRYGLTPEMVAAILESPTDAVFQDRRKGPRKALYKFYPTGSEEIAHLDDAGAGAWFRAVLDEDESLYTAFRDHFTEIEGGRPSWPTPNTSTNF